MALELAPGLTLFIARHGETEANVARRLQGHSVDTPLTGRGVQQAEAIASILRDHAPVCALDCVASPLRRAQSTMEIVRNALGLSHVGFRSDARLIEIDLGAWDGLTHEEAQERYPEAYAARQADKWNVEVPGGGENYAAVARRLSNFVEELSTDTFAVSHGGATRILRGLFAGMTWQEMSTLDEPQGVVFRVRGSIVDRLDS